jgi:hypothetical protein
MSLHLAFSFTRQGEHAYGFAAGETLDTDKYNLTSFSSHRPDYGIIQFLHA